MLSLPGVARRKALLAVEQGVAELVARLYLESKAKSGKDGTIRDMIHDIKRKTLYVGGEAQAFVSRSRLEDLSSRRRMELYHPLERGFGPGVRFIARDYQRIVRGTYGGDTE